jgi:hypothetical protein
MNADMLSTIHNPRTQRRFIVNLREIKTFEDSVKVLIVALRDLGCTTRSCAGRRAALLRAGIFLVRHNSAQHPLSLGAIERTVEQML